MGNRRMTRQEFEEGFAREAGRPWAELGRLAVPCDCDYASCPGWAAWPVTLLRSMVEFDKGDVAKIAGVLNCSDHAVRKIIKHLEAEDDG